MKTILERIAALFKLRFSERTIQAFIQFIKFSMIGVTNTLIYFIVNAIVIIFLRPYALPYDFIIGNILGFLISVLWSFYWNNKYVFYGGESNQRNIFGALIKAYISYGFTGIILNNILSYIWFHVFGISKIAGPLLNVIFAVPINFLLNKYWAFNNSDNKSKVN